MIDWKFEDEQLDAFDEYIKKNITGRQVKNNHIGYQEEEWKAFIAGWMAAKKQFRIDEQEKERKEK